MKTTVGVLAILGICFFSLNAQEGRSLSPTDPTLLLESDPKATHAILVKVKSTAPIETYLDKVKFARFWEWYAKKIGITEAAPELPNGFLKLLEGLGIGDLYIVTATVEKVFSGEVKVGAEITIAWSNQSYKLVPEKDKEYILFITLYKGSREAGCIKDKDLNSTVLHETTSIPNLEQLYVIRSQGRKYAKILVTDKDKDEIISFIEEFQRVVKIENESEKNKAKKELGKKMLHCSSQIFKWNALRLLEASDFSAQDCDELEKMLLEIINVDTHSSEFARLDLGLWMLCKARGKDTTEIQKLFEELKNKKR